jgi:hypothetical protein
MGSNKNMIRKQSVHFHISGNVDGLAIQQDVADWCRDVLNPSIDGGLAFYEQKDEVIQLNDIRLDIDLGSTVNWKDGLAEKILYNLKEKLYAKITGIGETVTIKTLPDNFSDVMLYYVKHGILPWYSVIKNREYLKRN